MIEAAGPSARQEVAQTREAPFSIPSLRGLAESIGLPGRALGYVAFVALGGTACFLIAAAQIDPSYVFGLVALTILAIAADRVNLRIPLNTETTLELTPSMMVNSVAVLLLPLPGAVIVAYLGALGGDILSRKEWYKALFNAGQMAVACTAAAIVWNVGTGGGVTDAAALYRTLPVALMATAIGYLLNTTLVSIVLALVSNASVWRVWMDTQFAGVLPQFGLQVMGILFAGAWLFDLRVVVLLLVPAFLTWMSSRHLRALEAKAQVEHDLRQQSEALAARWEALAQIGEQLGASVDPKVLVSTAAKVVVEHCADAACIVAPGTGVASAAAADAPPHLRARLAASAATIDGYVASGVMALPLAVGDRDLGTLYAAWASGGPMADQATLLDRVVERIAIALQNAKLSSEAAEVEALREIDRMKSDLLASVSHELTSPIALVMGYGELLETRPPQPEQAKWMGGKILTAGNHLKRMVEDLLDAGRLESGRLSLDRHLIDLREVAEGALESARATHTGPRFELLLPPQPVIVEADRTRLLQVLTNLLQNAARYGPTGGKVRLVIEAESDHACIAVEDEGPGVPPGERERIFEKFYRTEGAQAKAKKGLGLGLTIARDLVVAHGGRIKVEDAPSGGARFMIKLPRAEVVA
jgi:two-component system, OmpR family, sensor histidine kinase KdpD